MQNFVTNLANAWQDELNLGFFSSSFILLVGCQHSKRFSHFTCVGNFDCKLIYFDTNTYTTSKMSRMLCCRDSNIQRSSTRQRH